MLQSHAATSMLRNMTEDFRVSSYLSTYVGTRRNKFVQELFQHDVSEPQIAKFPCQAKFVGILG